MNKWKILSIFLIVTQITSIIAFTYFYYPQLTRFTTNTPKIDDPKEQLLTWAEKYNSEQWQKYLQNWQKIKGDESMKQVIKCRIDIDNKISQLEPIYLKALRENETGNATVESRYSEGIYKTLKNISDKLWDITYPYDRDEPDFQGGLFIYTKFDNNLDVFNQAYIDKNIVGTKQTLEYYNTQFNNDLIEAENVYCPKLDSIGAKPPMTSAQCIEIAKFINSTAVPEGRESFELQGEYEISLEKFEKAKISRLELCNSTSELNSPYFRF